jgi:hypothetical protein
MTTQLSSTLPTKVLYCFRSGVPLASVSSLCGGGWPFLQQINTSLIHPIYHVPFGALLTKMARLIDDASDAAWMLSDNDMLDLRLHMSACMYALDAIWQPPEEAVHLWHKLEPSLPSEAIAAACASRLFKVARWYHLATSKRMELPLYRVSKANSNLHWDNFSAWLDDAWSVHNEWESGRTELNRQYQLELHNEALQTIRSADVYKRIDFRKVWGWIDLQMRVSPKYNVFRREVYKDIFMTADTHPEQWTLDDIEDVQIAVMETCDRENDVYFFINQRLMNLRECIKSFYGSFTLLTDGGLAGLNEEAKTEQAKREQSATQEFFRSYDEKVASIEQLPPEPVRLQYATLPKFLQAQAQWRILKARFEASQKRKEQGA